LKKICKKHKRKTRKYKERPTNVIETCSCERRCIDGEI